MFRAKGARQGQGQAELARVSLALLASSRANPLRLQRESEEEERDAFQSVCVKLNRKQPFLPGHPCECVPVLKQ